MRANGRRFGRSHRLPILKRPVMRMRTRRDSDGDGAYQRRIVVKVGTTLLTDAAERIDLEVMASLAGQIARLHAQGADMLLVTSGAVAAGRHALGVSAGAKNLPLRQALAAVGQSHLMRLYIQLFDWQNVAVSQALLSRRDIADRLGYINIRNTLAELAAQRVVPIINENDVVSVDELKGEAFGDNDTLSALVANLVDASLLIILGNVDGVYTADPHLDPDARLIPVVERISDEDARALGGPSWDARGRGGMRAKLAAARLAAASGVDVVIANGRTPNVIERIAGGESVGTFLPATATKLESRKRWLLSGLSVKGEVGVDDGAVAALRERHRSLLPAGVVRTRGGFDRGDAVSIVDGRGAQVGCGIVNYSAADIAAIKGHHSHDISDILDYNYGDYIVHRNNMVIV